MLGLFGLSVIGVLGLLIIGFLALFLIPFAVALIPITLVGIILWTGIRWIAGLAWFIIMGAVSILQTLWYAIF
jgi:hypothetical protein